MGRNKKKPEYDPEKIMNELIESVVECYLATGDSKDEMSIRSIAEEFDITPLKVRKLLITAGVFATEISDEINDLFSQGKSIIEIQKITGLGRASVYSYLPYTKVIYNISEVSLNAERNRKYRERKSAVNRLKRKFVDKTITLDDVWDTMKLFQEYTFYTVRHKKFRYTMTDGEIFVTRKDKSITRSSVEVALDKVVEKEGIVPGPKSMDVFGSSYLYPVFIRIGIIKQDM